MGHCFLSAVWHVLQKTVSRKHYHIHRSWIRPGILYQALLTFWTCVSFIYRSHCQKEKKYCYIFIEFLRTKLILFCTAILLKKLIASRRHLDSLNGKMTSQLESPPPPRPLTLRPLSPLLYGSTHWVTNRETTEGWPLPTVETMGHRTARTCTAILCNSCGGTFAT
jgi:hypothetical protein